MDRKIFEECGRAFADGVAAALADHEKKSQKTPELIDRKALLRWLRDYQLENFARFGYEREYNFIENLIKGIENEPTIESAPVVHGEWIDAEQYVDEDGLRYTQVRCSLCGRYEDEREPYCNCGAKMDGKAAE